MLKLPIAALRDNQILIIVDRGKRTVDLFLMTGQCYWFYRDAPVFEILSNRSEVFNKYLNVKDG